MTDRRDAKLSKDADAATRTGGSCPICQRSTEAAFRPFCSKRCADVDLSRWLKGAYAIPIADADDDEDGEQIGSDERDVNPRRPPHDA